MTDRRAQEVLSELANLTLQKMLFQLTLVVACYDYLRTFQALDYDELANA